MLRLTERIACTDLGELWEFERRGVQGLVRILEARCADARFRSALEEIAGSLRRSRAPSLFPIVRHDWHGDHYYLVEYDSMNASSRSLSQHFKRTEWLARLRVARDIGELRARWRVPLGSPLGLHGGRIVVSDLGGVWRPHLLPCPELHARAPFDLRRVDDDILAAIPPERLRGPQQQTVVDDAQDMYCLGVLVLQALGFAPERTTGVDLESEERIEAQARGALVKRGGVATDIQTIPRNAPSIERMLGALLAVAYRHAEFNPAARPADSVELLDRCEAALSLDKPLRVAERLHREGKPREALEVLSWSFGKGGADPRARVFAASLCRELQRPREELRNLEGAAAYGDSDPELKRRRMELLYACYVEEEPPDPQVDPKGDRILELLEQLRFPNTDLLDADQLETAKEDRFRAAAIYFRRGDYLRRAQELYEATQLEWGDIKTKFLYGVSLRALADQEGPGGPSELALRELRQVVEQRLRRMAAAGVVEQDDVGEWMRCFQELQQP